MNVPNSLPNVFVYVRHSQPATNWIRKNILQNSFFVFTKKIVKEIRISHTYTQNKKYNIINVYRQQQQAFKQTRRKRNSRHHATRQLKLLNTPPPYFINAKGKRKCVKLTVKNVYRCTFGVHFLVHAKRSAFFWRLTFIKEIKLFLFIFAIVNFVLYFSSLRPLNFFLIFPHTYF